MNLFRKRDCIRCRLAGSLGIDLVITSACQAAALEQAELTALDLFWIAGYQADIERSFVQYLQLSQQRYKEERCWP